MRRWKFLNPGQRVELETCMYANSVTVRNERGKTVVISDDMRSDFEQFWRRNAQHPLKGEDTSPGFFVSNLSLPREFVLSKGVRLTTLTHSGNFAVEFGPWPSARNHILKSICPQTFGLYLVKLACALTVIGGVPMEKSSTRIRGESHLLLVGDPGDSCILVFLPARQVALRCQSEKGTPNCFSTHPQWQGLENLNFSSMLPS
mgnify:FL=1